jgi:hypothetical protein
MASSYPTRKKSLAERIAELKGEGVTPPSPFAPGLEDLAPGVRDPIQQAREATEVTNRAKGGNFRPVAMVAGVSNVPAKKEPLAIRVLRLPGKPADARNAFLRRLGDEARYGSGPGQAVLESVRTAWRALTDLDRDVPPTAVRAAAGVKKGESSRLAYNTATVLDYLLDFTTDPSVLITGPAGKALAKIPAVAKAGAATRAVTTAAKGQVARAAGQVERRVLGDETSASSRLLASTLGVGPAARMMREVRGAYEPGVGHRLKEAEAILARKRAWTLTRRRQDPLYSRIVETYQTKNPGGVDPLTDGVRMYVRAHRHKGKTPTSATRTPLGHPAIDPGDEHQIRVFAKAYRLDYDTIRQFGDDIIGHAETTLADLRKVGDVPFEQARGLQSKRPLTGSQKFPTQAWTGIHNQAKARAEDRLRSVWFGRYLEDLLPHSEVAGAALHTLKRASATRGGRGEVRAGIENVRRAGIRDLVQRLEGAGPGGKGTIAPYGAIPPGSGTPLSAHGYVQRWTPGSPVPEGWVVVTNHKLPLPSEGARVPMAKEMEFLRDRMMPRDLYNYLAGEMGAFIPTVTKAGRSLGVEGPILQARGRFWETWTRVIGGYKRGRLMNPATFLSNAFGNHMLADIALARHGVSQAEFTRALKEALPEAFHFERTAQASPDIDRLGRRTRAFHETIAEGAGVRPGQSGRAAAGAAGKRVEVPGIGPVILPSPDFSQVTGTGWKKAKQVAGAVGKTSAAELERMMGALGSVHGLSERTYKLALFKALAPKLGDDEAAKVVQSTLFDYSDRPALLEAADRYGLVIFNAFPVFATRALFETLATRPDLVARYPRLARLTRQETGTEGDFDALKERDQASHLVGVGKDRFVDPSRYFPLAGPIDWLSRPGEGLTTDGLARQMAGGTAFSPVIEQAFNMRLIGGTENPWRIVPKGAPPPVSPSPLPDFAEGVSGDLRAREFLNSVLPGVVRPIGRQRAANEGVSYGTGLSSEAQDPAEAFLQGFIGMRRLQGEPYEEKDKRTAQMQGERVRAYLPLLNQARLLPLDQNPYRIVVREITSKMDVDRKLTDLTLYVDQMLGNSVDKAGKLTDLGRQRLSEAALWEAALLHRMREMP